MNMFQYGQTTVVTDLDVNGKVWFRAFEVIKELGFAPEHTSRLLEANVSLEWRQKRIVGAGQPAWFICEPGIYQLGFKSSTDQARAFQRWVFEEVLPSIRKDGGYIRLDATPEQLTGLRERIDEQVKVALELRSKGLSNGMVEKIMFPAMKKQATRVDGHVTKDSAWLDVQAYFKANPNAVWSDCTRTLMRRSKYKNLFDANTFKVWKADWMKQGLLKRDGKKWIAD